MRLYYFSKDASVIVGQVSSFQFFFEGQDVKNHTSKRPSIRRLAVLIVVFSSLLLFLLFVFFFF